MLLFLMGIDYTTLFVVLALLVLLGMLIFRIIKRILRKRMTQASDAKLNIISRLCAFILSPVILFGLFALIIYFLSI